MIHKLKNLFFNSLGFIDTFILLYLITLVLQDNEDWVMWLLYAIPIWVLYINIKYFLKVFQSNEILEYFVMNHRTIRTEGGQGEGKTSFLGKLLAYADRMGYKVFSLTPFKINGKFAYKLKMGHMTLKKKLPEKAFGFADEFTLKFNNKVKVQDSDDVYAFTITVQLLRHLFDGNFAYASVDSDRALKELEELFIHRYQMKGQTIKSYSFILAPLFRVLTGWKYYGTYRIWELQNYEQIREDNYIYDLSNDEADTNRNRFANLLTVVSYNNKDFEYNDRVLKALYDALPIEEDTEAWESLDMTAAEITEQYPKIVQFLVNKRKLDLMKIDKMKDAKK